MCKKKITIKKINSKNDNNGMNTKLEEFTSNGWGAIIGPTRRNIQLDFRDAVLERLDLAPTLICHVFMTN